MFKNTASQKVIVFAFDSTTNLPKSGDSANITAYVTKDFGAVTALTDTSATEMDATNAKGYYLFDISQTETNADVVGITAKSSTANIVVVGAPATIFTFPTGGVASPTNITAITGNITGNLSGSVGSVTGAVGSVTAGVTVTTNNDKTGYSLTQTFPTNFSAMAITAGGAVTAGTVSDKTGYSLTAVTGLGNQTANITGSITTATNLTTNNDKTGYSLTATTGLGNQTANITGNLSGSVNSVTTGVTVASGGIINGANAAAELNNIADAILDRVMSAGTDSGLDNASTRTVRQALRALRNRVAIAAGTMTVYKENDTTLSWSSAITTTAGNPVSESNPT